MFILQRNLIVSHLGLLFENLSLKAVLSMLLYNFQYLVCLKVTLFETKPYTINNNSNNNNNKGM